MHSCCVLKLSTVHSCCVFKLSTVHSCCVFRLSTVHSCCVFELSTVHSCCVFELSTVHDASAKLPPGLLNGNVNQYGDIDQCLRVKTSWQGGVIKGRYCLTTMALRLSDPRSALLKQLQQLLQSHDMVRSELDDVSETSDLPLGWLVQDCASITASPHRTVRWGLVILVGTDCKSRQPRALKSLEDMQQCLML